VIKSDSYLATADFRRRGRTRTSGREDSLNKPFWVHCLGSETRGKRTKRGNYNLYQCVVLVDFFFNPHIFLDNLADLMVSIVFGEARDLL